MSDGVRYAPGTDPRIAMAEHSLAEVLKERDALRQSCADLGAAIALERDATKKAESRVVDLEDALRRIVEQLDNCSPDTGGLCSCQDIMAAVAKEAL